MNKDQIVLSIKMEVLDEDKRKYMFKVLKAELNFNQEKALKIFIENMLLNDNGNPNNNLDFIPFDSIGKLLKDD